MQTQIANEHQALLTINGLEASWNEIDFHLFQSEEGEAWQLWKVWVVERARWVVWKPGYSG